MLKLPIDVIVGEFEEAIGSYDNFIIQASPGSGKSTRLAPSLLKVPALGSDKKILMLQPRRIAAKAIAARIAQENGWKLGGSEVGYHVRLDRKYTHDTRLIVMTEGLLSRYILDDPELKNVACVILDEFHERNIYSDVALSMLKELQSAYRPDLKIVVMSATLDMTKLREYLPDAKVLELKLEIFPQHVIYQPKKDRREFSKTLEREVFQALEYLLNDKNDDGGSVLVFLPGIAEIRRAKDLIIEKFKNIEILELHSSLPIEQQSKVLSPPSQRRVILSTNIAETSLTVPGVTAVIDSGYVKLANWNASSLTQTLELKRISLASAVQRAGRASRISAGRVYKLWSKDEEAQFKNFEIPEIHRADLSTPLLSLMAWGVSDFDKYPWYEVPDKSKVDLALNYLKSIEAISFDRKITELGTKIQRLPLVPHLSRMLVEAAECGLAKHAAMAIAILTERDPFQNNFENRSGKECDLEARVLLIEEFLSGASSARSLGLDEHLLQKITRISEDLYHSVSRIPIKLPRKSFKELLFSAFSFRLCKRREMKSPKAVMVGGRGVFLDTKSLVEESAFFLALDLLESANSTETRVLYASGMSLDELRKVAGSAIEERSSVNLDLKSLKLNYIRGVFFKDLMIEGPFPLHKKDSLLDTGPLLRSIVENEWGKILVYFPDLAEFNKRITFYNTYCAEKSISELEPKIRFNLISTAVELLQQEPLAKIDWSHLLNLFYPASDLKELNQTVPLTLKVPSGREIKLDYSDDFKTVKCSVKLQELFGLARSPAILKGKLPVVFELLSPAQRPVQVTQDLESFWKNAYPQLRSELKIKYPRHPWPEDPWTAQATHKTIRKK